MPHLRRPELKARHPVHVTVRLVRGLPTLRQKPLTRIVFEAFRAAKARFGTRLVQFSVQSNHLHIIVEVSGKPALARAMQGLGVRLARRLNERLKRRGRVFSDRYHARALRTPLHVRRALVYVLRNNCKHSRGLGRPSRFDPMSTAAYFDGFSTPLLRWPKHGFVPPDDPPVARSETWLLRTGWRQLGLITPRDKPA